ncbi:hypothetical protein CZ771_10975 [Actinomycetales bacterium JB111]|nr:hypothetical protein CZ771_10975 [Actinomycetales bacterium JB111]
MVRGLWRANARGAAVREGEGRSGPSGAHSVLHEVEAMARPSRGVHGSGIVSACGRSRGAGVDRRPGGARAGGVGPRASGGCAQASRHLDS